MERYFSPQEDPNGTYDSLRFLAQAAVDLADFDVNSNIYDYCAQALHRLSGGAIIIVNSVQPAAGTLKTEACAGIDAQDAEIKSLLDSSLLGAEYHPDRTFDELLTGRLEQFSAGLHEISFGKIPREAARQIEQMLQIDEIYGTAFILDKQIYANTLLIYTEGRQLQNKLAIETFVQQASIALRRQHAEYDLRHSRQRAERDELLMYITEDLTEVGGWEKDIASDVLNLSRGCRQIYGIESETIPAEELDKTLPPRDYQKVKSTFHRVVHGAANGNSNGYFDIEHRIIRVNDNEQRTLRSHGIVIRDNLGRPIKLLGAVQDITEQKNADKEIRRFRELLDRTNDAIVIHSTSGERIIDVNHTACLLSGFTREELLQMSIFDLDMAADTERIKHEIETSGFARFETQNRCADGSSIETEVNLSLLTIQEETFLVAIIRDVSERTKLEREKEERRKYLETVLRSVPDAVITLDKNHKVIEWNLGAENLFGYTSEEVVGKPLDALIAHTSDEIMAEALSYTRQVNSGISTNFQEVIRFSKAGSAINVLMSATPIMIDGDMIGALGVYVDVSSLKEAEQNVHKLLQEKEQLMKEVHHRIKNHMNTMYSILSVQESYFSNPDVKDAFEEAKNRIRLMQSIYYKLYSSSNSNSIELRSFVDELVRNLQAAYATDSHIGIHTVIDDVQITAKQSLPIGIIVTELITNSLKYAFVGGESGNIAISLHHLSTDKLKIVVEDNGIGAPPEIIKDKEYGFGLTLVEGYALQFDGSVEIENHSGTRITIHITLEHT
ncbi:MAG: PAS domain S-box protein [Spirochaetia bacterium]